MIHCDFTPAGLCFADDEYVSIGDIETYVDIKVSIVDCIWTPVLIDLVFCNESSVMLSCYGDDHTRERYYVTV